MKPYHRHIFRFISLWMFVLFAVACNRPDVEPCDDYRQAMRDFVAVPRESLVAGQLQGLLLVFRVAGAHLRRWRQLPEPHPERRLRRSLFGHRGCVRGV